jgi:hypothetical protein
MQMKFCKFDDKKKQATFINESNGCQVRLSAAMLPEEIRLGDSVEIAILPDVAKLQEMQANINSLLTSVTSLKRNQIQEMKEQAYIQIIKRVLNDLVRGHGGRYYLVNLKHAAETIAKALCGEKK